MVPHTITSSDGPIWRCQWKLATCVPHDPASHGCDHHDTVNRIEIRLKIRRHNIPVFRFAIEHTANVGAPVCVVISRVFKAIASELIVHAAANGVELFGQTLVLLQTTPFLTRGSWRGCTIHKASNVGKKSVLLAVSSSRPLCSSTIYRINLLNP